MNVWLENGRFTGIRRFSHTRFSSEGVSEWVETELES